MNRLRILFPRCPAPRKAGPVLPISLMILGMLLGCGGEPGTAPEKGEKEGKPTAREVIGEAIAFHGMEGLDQDTLRFRFREKKYVFKSHEGLFEYQRIFTDTSGDTIRDVLTHNGLERYRNDSLVPLSAKDSAAYSHSVNSVIYFAFLPYRLTDDAIIASREGKDTLQKKIYHRIKVTFREKGGGKDHEDTFMYWFHTEDASMDYLAYRYHTEGGGVRFRVAYEPRRIEGMLIQDYHNYKAPYQSELEKLAEQWEKGALEKVSEIEVEFTEQP